LSSALFPRIAAAGVEDGRRLTEESVSILAFALTPLTLGVFLLAGPFLALWLGGDTGTAMAPLAFILAGGAWANSLARIAFAELQARGRPDLPARTHLAELIPYAALLYVTLATMGVAGAAVAWSIRCLADAAILFWFSHASLRTLRPLLVDLLLVGLGLGCALAFPLWSLAKAALIVAIGIVWLAFAWRRRPPRLDALLAEWSAGLKRRRLRG
jgi:O-antigen/teichoic acid export membrane protein